MTPPRPIYLDHHATTPCATEVVQAMLPWFTERFGNAASRTHAWGRDAREAVEDARAQVAALVGASPREVVFTSGATESDNLAVLGTLAGWGASGGPRHRGRDRVIVAATEHHAVLDAAQHHAARGGRVTVLPVAGDGRVDPEALRRALADGAGLVAIMGANNEIGVEPDLPAVAEVCREAGVPWLCDAVQSAGWRAPEAGVGAADLVAVSGHKLYGPKGIGALIVRQRRPRLRVQPQMHGGGHERGLRSGTLNVPAIVGLGVACALTQEAREADGQRVGGLRDRLQARLQAGVDDLVLHGALQHRLPNTLSVAFPGVEGVRLREAVPHLGLSAGSACSSDTLAPSYVLRAMGVPDALAYASVRIGLGRTTTEADVDEAGDALVAAVRSLRG